jgi:hypothetical protein
VRYVWRYDGTVAPGWPKRTGDVISASTAVGNLDSDPQLGVVVASRDGYIYAWNYDGTGLLSPNGVFRQVGGSAMGSPVIDDLEVQKEGLMPSLVKRAGELGLLAADIPEEYGGQDLDKVSSLLVWEKMAQGGGSFMSAFGAHTGIGTLPILYYGNEEQVQNACP